MRVILLAALLVSALGCGGRRTAKPVDVTDAGVATDGATAIAPFSGRIVARSVDPNVQLVPMKDDGLVVTSGPAIWRVGADAVLERIGTPADAIPLLLPGDDELGGYDARLFDAAKVSGPATNPFVSLTSGGVFRWTGKEWSRTATAPEPERRASWRTKPDPDATGGLPAGYDWSQRTESSSQVVWIGSKPFAGEGMHRLDDAVIAATPGHPAHVVDFPVALGKAPKYRSCELIDSADDRIYVGCVSSVDATGDLEHADYVLDGDHWTRLARDLPENAARVFDAEGALWYVRGVGGGPSSLVRIARDGTEERFDLPVAPPELNAPVYRSQDVPLVTRGHEIHHWIATTISAQPPADALRWVHELVARRSGDVWAVGRDSGGVSILRFARGGGGPAPTFIRSGVDERSAVQAARGIRTWGGRCNSVFIPFPHGVVPAAFSDVHAAEIEALVATTDHKDKDADVVPLEVAVVEGRLAGHEAGGILIIQSDPDVDEKRLVKAIQKLSELATPDPASPPNVTCTLPELDRVIKRLRTANVHPY